MTASFCSATTSQVSISSPTLRLCAISIALLVALAAMSSPASAKSQCQNGVCIKWLTFDDPKTARFKITGTYLVSAVFNLRQGSSQHEVRAGAIISVPRSHSFALQLCHKCALCLSSKCNPWGTYTPSQYNVDDKDRKVAVVNGSTAAFAKLFASSPNSKNWGVNRFKKGKVLMPGMSKTLDFTDGSGDCIFDFRAVLATGREIEKRRVDVCFERSVVLR